VINNFRKEWKEHFAAKYFADALILLNYHFFKRGASPLLRGDRRANKKLAKQGCVNEDLSKKMRLGKCSEDCKHTPPLLRHPSQEGTCSAIIFTVLLFFFFHSNLTAQSPFSNLRTKTIPVKTEWQQIDSLTIDNKTLKVSTLDNKRVSNFQYQVFNNQIKFQPAFIEKKIVITYRVLPFNLSEPTFRIDTNAISKTMDGILLTHDPFADSDELPDFGKLNYNGTFSRGISFGNSQNLVLNSALNLQMSGRLTDDIEILAAITDNSIPLQPEGNTAQLQEFDKVFVQLKRKNSTLIAGDYELRRPKRYFINYFKKLQGATFSNTTNIEEEKQLNTRASVAIARGKFARNILPAQEGNQGPYRLSGNENERFIIVLAGTEKVFLNGEQLKRGMEADYVIDYNAASIRFTYKRLINKDSRIVVEFEYTDQSYLRSLSTVDLDYSGKKADFFFTFYAEQDSKNSTADGSLSDAEKLLLTQAGDTPMGAVSSGVFPEEEFNVLRVNYTLRDTMICGKQDSILTYSVDESQTVFTARFTQVGQGMGNYVLDTEQGANGRVYRWVPPIDCQPQGDFEPILLLIAPRQQQLISGGANIKIIKNGSLKIEGIMSRFDLNRFSEIDDEDNMGLAGFTQFNHLFDFGKKKKDFTIETNASYEIRNNNFEYLNRYRPQEFTRDWNLSQVLNGQLGPEERSSLREEWAQANLKLKKQNWGAVKYGFGSFERVGDYNGTRHNSEFSLSRNGYEAKINGSFLDSKTLVERTQFFRPKIAFSKSFQPKIDSTGKKNSGNWNVGFIAEREHNQRIDLATDTLNKTSFFYDFFKTFLEFQGNENFSSAIGASRRWDHLPLNKNFEFTTVADDLEWTGKWRQSKTAFLNWSMNYRQLTVQNQELSNQESGETYLGRLGYHFLLWKGALRSTTNYQISSGQEPKVEFNYLRVNDGEGVFQWNDYNDDGIPQQNEFETAVFQDSANFVRVSILTDEFIRSNNTQFDQNLQLDPKAIWRESKGFKKFLSRFSEISIWQISRRVRNVDGVSQWNPFELNIVDTALVALNSSLRNTLFFNRGSRVFDLQFGWNDLQNRVVITTGFESRNQQEQFMQLRWNLSREWTFKTRLANQNQSNDSENFDNRDYKIALWETEPSLTWQTNNNLRTILSYKRRDAENQITPEQLQTNEIKFEGAYNFSNKKQKYPTSLRTSLTFADVNFEGEANSPAGFVLLQGLRNGRNLLWNLNLDRQLVNNMRLSLNYEGRKTGVSRIVHVGRVQVAAVF